MPVRSVKYFYFDYYRYILAPAVLLLALYSVFLMKTIFELRITEVSFHLRSESTRGDAASSILLSRFELILYRKEMGETSEAYLREGRLMTVMSALQKLPEENRGPAFLVKPAILVINIVAELTRSEPFQVTDGFQKERLLQAAYIFERKRKFTEAIELYEKTENEYALAFDEQAYVHLHKGFSLAAKGHFEPAIHDLEAVLTEAPDTEMAYTADVLLSYLRSFLKQKQKIMQLPDSVSKGQRFFEIMAYDEAVTLLNDLEITNRSQRLYFYRGRSHEETGNIAEALNDYRYVIKLDSDSEYGIKANRRLYLLSTFYEKNTTLQQQALVNSIKNGDSEFVDTASKYEKALTLEAEEEFMQNSENSELISESGVRVEEQSLFSTEEKSEGDISEVEKLKQRIAEQAKEAESERSLSRKIYKELDIDKYKASEPEQRSEILKDTGRYVHRIKTQTMGTIVGRIIRRKNGEYRVLTLYGEVTIPENEVIERERLETDKLNK